jgi:hypothetical protein
MEQAPEEQRAAVVDPAVPVAITQTAFAGGETAGAPESQVALAMIVVFAQLGMVVPLHPHISGKITMVSVQMGQSVMM